MQEISRTTWWLLTALVMSVVVIASALYGGQLGFWEPFESVTVRAGAETLDVDLSDDDAATSDDASDLGEAAESRAVPTVDGEPVHTSWLKSTWTSYFVDAQPVVEHGEVGDVERRARMLLLLMAVLFLGAAALWTRHHLGEAAAAMTVVVLATTPLFYLGALYLSGPLLYVGASTLSIMAFFHAAYDDVGGLKWRLAWAVLGGLSLVVVALDVRLVGVYATVAVLVGMAVSQCVSDGQSNSTPRGGLDPIPAVLAVIIFAVTMAWGWMESAEYEEALFRPDIAQTLWLVAPLSLLAGFAISARRSRVGSALCGLPGLAYAGLGALAIVALGWAYASVLPTDPDLAEEGSLAIAYLLENAHLADGVEAPGDFSWWWRPIGFGFLPYVIFLIPALGYLGWKLRPDAETTEVERAVATLCLVWPAATFAVVVPAAELGHTVFPAFFPLVLATGWMVSDVQFWKKMRLQPFFYLATCVIAVFMLTILTKDIDEFPTRLVEFALGGAEDVGLADDFAYGEALGQWARWVRLALIAYFVGLISWTVFLWGDVKRFAGWLRGCWRSWREGELGGDAQNDVDAGGRTDGRGAGERRMEDRERWRDGDGLVPRLACRLERQPGLVALVVATGLGLMAVFFSSIIADLDDQFSSRAVLEQYLEVSEDDESLWRFEIDEEDDGFYVRGLDAIENRSRFNAKYDDTERLFALIPDASLARINSRVRRDQGENLPILAGGGGMYLVTNILADDEEDFNPLSDYVMDEPDDEYVAITYEIDGEERHPEFDGQFEYLGYRLDRGGEGERAVYRWGESMEITQYFKVNQRVPSSQQIFMHVDFSGNRLHGDHDPVGGLYPTNYWQPGDVIKDVYEIEIDRFSAPGVYTVWMGFYRSDNRMSVTPEEAHDGGDRLEVTTIEVVPF